MNNKVNPQGWLLVSVAIFLGAMYSQYAFYDLGRNISKSDAKKIQVAYQESLLSPAGYDFRDALSNLLDDKGIIVPAELSYIGTDIYSNSFTKEDWNKLAKIHKKTNKYKCIFRVGKDCNFRRFDRLYCNKFLFYNSFNNCNVHSFLC